MKARLKALAAYAGIRSRERTEFDGKAYRIAPNADNLSFNLVQEGDKAHYVSGALQQNAKIYRSRRDVVLNAASTVRDGQVIQLRMLAQDGYARADGQATPGRLGFMLEHGDSFDFKKDGNAVVLTITDTQNQAKTIRIDGASLDDITIGRKGPSGQHEGMVTLAVIDKGRRSGRRAPGLRRERGSHTARICSCHDGRQCQSC